MAYYWYLIIAVCIFVAFLGWAICALGGEADRDIEKMMKDK